jgi:hypothetical protein
MPDGFCIMRFRVISITKDEEVFMQKYQTVLVALFIALAIVFAGAQPGRGAEITFAGVTHAVYPDGVYTNLGLGVDVYPDSVITAYVEDPGGDLVHTYSPDEFIEDMGDKFYWYRHPGPPKEGPYTFTVEFTTGTRTYQDTQGPLVTLPIIEAGQVTVEGNHTTTPTFSWPDVSPGNYYRIQAWDDNGNTLFRSMRSKDLTVTIPPGTLPKGIEFTARVEVHDSDTYATLNNRANGENLYLDTILIPWAQVYHVNTVGGQKTWLDLGINIDQSQVLRAYVDGPNSFHYEFLANDFDPTYSSYFRELDGAPALGDYTFTVELKNGESQSVTDTQDIVENLPIVGAGEIEIIGEDGVTPTFRWPEVPGRVLFSRLRIYIPGGDRVVDTRRLGGTAYTVFPGELQPNTTYEVVVERHDSFSYDSLQNRTTGERLQFTTGDLPGPPSGTLEVVTVPWVANSPLIPHDAYNGQAITFKAIARGGDGTYTYEWDFDGDGTYDSAGISQNAYDLSARHTYPDQQFDRVFIARIRVTSGDPLVTVTADYPVRVHATATQAVKVNVAIDEALWWMHQKMLRYDSGPVQFGALTNQMLGATGAAVQAWENQGHKPGGDYASNPYVEDVRRGMNFILSRTHPYPIHTEDGRNPDTLVNGYGLHSIHQSQLYETGIVLMALASSGDRNLVSEVGGFGLLGRTYGDLAQDMGDFLAFAQNEPDVGQWRGGWRYGPNYEQSDMSVTQWPVIGLEAAESNFGISVPQYVKDELEIYLAADQDADGGFGYTSPGGNVARTGAGIACLAWIGAPDSDPRVTSAIGFIDNNWDWDHFGNFYAKYAVMKGMRGFEPDIEMIGGHDWYAEYADYLITKQYDDGSWTGEVWYGRDMSTATGVLILTPEVFMPPPVAVARAQPTEASPGTVITFDHSGSFHRDAQRRLVSFRWDFDENGTWDFETGDITANPTWIYDDSISCGEEVEHLAVLEVADDLGNTDVDDETVLIRINLQNHPPVADGDPSDSFPNYYVTPGKAVILDASQSYDPDESQGDYIVEFEWDLDSDGNYDTSGETYSFNVPQDWQPGSLHTVTLRVTDNGHWADGCTGSKPNLTDEVTVVLAVGSGPECSDAEPSISTLWPPNHKYTGINISGVMGSQGNPAEITITGITQDEPVNGLGDGDQSPDGAGVGTATAQVRAERSGTGNGRVYAIRFIARDDSSASCQGTVNVSVPHDKEIEAVDDGQNYDSTRVE